ncbi:hypothetical protein ADINL_0785 [Nitrincola lacisaponensis]|uniref:Uncharacterized protein n=1 Tax=Nitrincola lacisaponensis TaxID=267850 RepID=A0A063Y1J2_9GAMM|nr:hypothetical protein ADINL_0785 [Nitrincola lacisaponensis]
MVQCFEIFAWVLMYFFVFCFVYSMSKSMFLLCTDENTKLITVFGT